MILGPHLVPIKNLGTHSQSIQLPENIHHFHPSSEVICRGNVLPWVVTKSVRSRAQAAEMSFLRQVSGKSIRVRSSFTPERLGVDLLLLRLERRQLGWFRASNTVSLCTSHWEETPGQTKEDQMEEVHLHTG